jgi:hypothetical protein
MWKNRFISFTFYCLVSVVLSLKYNRFLSFFDLILIIFLSRLIKTDNQKDILVYIFISGVFFDYLYQTYFGVGFLIFYTLFLIKILFHNFSDLTEESILTLFIIISAIGYKIFLAFITKEYFQIHVFKNIFSVILNTTIIYTLHRQNYLKRVRLRL